MTQPRLAPHPSELICGRSLGSFINLENSYGINLPDYLQPLAIAVQTLSNLNVHEDEYNTRLAAQFVICSVRDLIEEAAELLNWTEEDANRASK